MAWCGTLSCYAIPSPSLCCAFGDTLSWYACPFVHHVCFVQSVRPCPSVFASVSVLWLRNRVEWRCFLVVSVQTLSLWVPSWPSVLSVLACSNEVATVDRSVDRVVSVPVRSCPFLMFPSCSVRSCPFLMFPSCSVRPVRLFLLFRSFLSVCSYCFVRSVLFRSAPFVPVSLFRPVHSFIRSASCSFVRTCFLSSVDYLLQLMVCLVPSCPVLSVR